MAKVGVPIPGENAVCEGCGLIYPLDEDGEPKTDGAYTCDDCGEAVEVIDRGARCAV